jgi:1,2-diacylglycerol-3-alpha-glucose alpha-1,2-glucosyltransferase
MCYKTGDLFLFLTHEETEGIVLLEALSMKIPSLKGHTNI